MFGDQANVIGQFKPNNNASYGNTYNSNWRNHPNFSWKPRALQYTQPGQASQQASNLEQAIVNLSKVVGDFVGDQKSINAQLSQRIDSVENTAREGKFPSQPHQNCKGIHEVEAMRENLHRGLNVNKKAFLIASKSHHTVQVSSEVQRSGLPYHLSDDWRKVSGESFVGLGASVNLLPYSVYKQLGLGELKPTSITLSLADRSVKIPRGMIEDVLVQVDNFYYPVDFVVLDTTQLSKETNYVPIILGRPFLATSNAIINCRNGLMQLTFGNMTLELNIFYIGGPKAYLKPLPTELKYAYLEENKKCPVVISSSLTTPQEECLLEVLRRCKKAIGWQISDLKGISPLVCTHHIYMEEEAKPVRQPQRRLNPHMQEVVRAEVLKLLQAGIFLGHIISKKDIEVDKAKVELIVKLPSPTTVKGDAKFVWDERCQKSFKQLKQFLTTAPIMRAPNWQLPFEVMCDASDFAIGAVLGQREDGKPYVIYYASKTLNEVQRNYTTTKRKNYAKARLIRWILLLQEFNLQIKDKKGVENVVADHLSRSCDRCQRLGKLTRRNQMPMNPILIVDLFDVWGIDFMGPFPIVVLKFLKENIFSRFGVPKAIISGGGTHFCNKPFETLLAKYGVKHKVATPYHPQTSGQVELANREIRNILMKSMAKHAISLVEVEYKAWWAIKKRMKRWHDQLISNKEFQKGQRVLLYDSKLHIFPRKLKSRWIGPFIIHQVHSNGVVELLNSNSTDTFKVNGHRLKPFMEPFNQDKEEVSFLEPQQS
ncbi:hypothetical protein CK203_046476 [Vitis vinifera]|uniref:Integrase catalytic domain-containing protein n=1 Tax=Vitis vinifera TaxID=29760 RepID=A0A438ILK7_VITVI|nr:hypothetical protein CK203_046476 [Vitis vinifera]